jgi:hypothetical protein
VTNTTTHNNEPLNNLRPLTAGLMDRAQAAEFLTSYGLRISRAILAKYAVSGEGPAFARFGRRIARAALGIIFSNAAVTTLLNWWLLAH